MERVKKQIADGNILQLTQQFLDQAVMEECKAWTPMAETPAGAVISPLLANIYLHELDVHMNKQVTHGGVLSENLRPSCNYFLISICSFNEQTHFLR